MAAKTLKNQYRLQIVTFKLSRKGKKTQTRKEKPKATYSMAFLSAENKNWQLEDLPQADFGRLPEIFRPLFVFVVFRRSFSSWALAPTLFTIFNWELSILLFSFINQIDFLVIKGLLSIYIYDKPNNTWLLVDVKLLFSRAIEFNTRREIPYLRAPIRYSLVINSLMMWTGHCKEIYYKANVSSVSPCQGPVSLLILGWNNISRNPT